MSIYKKSLYHENNLEKSSTRKTKLTMDDVNSYLEGKDIYNEFGADEGTHKDTTNNSNSLYNKVKGVARDAIERTGEYVKSGAKMAALGGLAATGAVAQTGIAAGMGVKGVYDIVKGIWDGFSTNDSVGKYKGYQVYVPNIKKLTFDWDNADHKKFTNPEKLKNFNKYLTWGLIGGAISNFFKTAPPDPPPGGKVQDPPKMEIHSSMENPELNQSQFSANFSKGNSDVAKIFEAGHFRQDQIDMLDQWAIKDDAKFKAFINMIGRSNIREFKDPEEIQKFLDNAINKVAYDVTDQGAEVFNQSAIVNYLPDSEMYDEANEGLMGRIGQGIFGTKNATGSAKKNMLKSFLRAGLLRSYILINNKPVSALIGENGKFNHQLAERQVEELSNKITRWQTGGLFSNKDDMAKMYIDWMTRHGFKVESTSGFETIDPNKVIDEIVKGTGGAEKDPNGPDGKPNTGDEPKAGQDPNGPDGKPNTGDEPKAGQDPNGPKEESEFAYDSRDNTLKLKPLKKGQTITVTKTKKELVPKIRTAILKDPELKAGLKQAGIDLNTSVFRVGQTKEAGRVVITLENIEVLNEEEFQAGIAGNSNGNPPKNPNLQAKLQAGNGNPPKNPNLQAKLQANKQAAAFKQDQKDAKFAVQQQSPVQQQTNQQDQAYGQIFAYIKAFKANNGIVKPEDQKKLDNYLTNKIKDPAKINNYKKEINNFAKAKNATDDDIKRAVGALMTGNNSEIDKYNDTQNNKFANYDKPTKIKIGSLKKGGYADKIKAAILGDSGGKGGTISDLIGGIFQTKIKGRTIQDVQVGQSSAGKLTIIIERFESINEEELFTENTKHEIMTKGYTAEQIQNILF